jgi:hypothetical protein
MDRVRVGLRFPWLVGGLALAVFGLVVLSLLVFPGYLVQRSLDATGAPALGPAERLKAENDARTTLLQGVAGLVLVVGAGATWRQLQINREGQITERFNKAIDHLGDRGDDRIDVRLGGIYALERIANNSKDDRATIAEILTAFVRGHAAWTTPPEDADPSAAARAELAELRVRAPDIQAVITVLGRRALPGGKPQPLRLAHTDLRRADLVGAHLEGRSSSVPTWSGRTSTTPTWSGRTSTTPTWRAPTSAAPSWTRRTSAASTWRGRTSKAPTWRGRSWPSLTWRGRASLAPTWRGRSSTTLSWRGRTSTAPTWRARPSKAPTWRGRTSAAPTWRGRAPRQIPRGREVSTGTTQRSA